MRRRSATNKYNEDQGRHEPDRWRQDRPEPMLPKEPTMTPSDVKATLSFSDGSPSMDLPIYKGTIGPT